MWILVAIYNTNPHYSDPIADNTTTVATVTTTPSTGDEIGVESRQENENVGIWLERNEFGYVVNITCVEQPSQVSIRLNPT